MRHLPVDLTRRAVVALLASAAPFVKAYAVDAVRLGLVPTLSQAPFYIAQERGYFRDLGIEVTFRFFESAQPAAAAAVAGDIDIGVTALTGGFFNLAEKGFLKLIGGGLREEKDHEGMAIVVSNKAFDDGLTAVEKLGGHSFAITQYGSAFEYIVSRIAEERGYDIDTIQLRPVQQVANTIAAVASGQIDATIAIASRAKPLAESGQIHIIGWVGDIIPFEYTALFTTQRMIEQNPAALHRFCEAYQRGVADYREAFLRRDAAGKPVIDGKTDAAIANITVYVFTGDAKAREKILEGVGYYDAGAPLDVGDVKQQLRVFRQRGRVKGDADPDTLIDTHFMPMR